MKTRYIFSPPPSKALFLVLLFALSACSPSDETDALPWNVGEENQQPGGDTDGDGDGTGDSVEEGSAHSILLLDENATLNATGYTPEFRVDVPDNVLSMTVTVTEGDPEAQFSITGWRNPDGFMILPNRWEQSSQSGMCYPDCNNRVVLSAGAFSALAPNNPASKVDPGEHRFTVFGVVAEGFQARPASGSVRVQVHAKVVDDEVPLRGVLDLNFYFTGANDWTAASAKEDPEFDELIERLNEIYDQVGITIGEVSFNDADSSYRVITDATSGTGDLSELFASTGDSPLMGPNVFFVDELRAGAGSPFGMIAGIAGGIPGPIRTQGSVRSGVAIATEILDDPEVPFGIAEVVGHELGHYLGLFHTTENEIAQMFPGFMPAHDPLPDTPENDPSYLMFYSGSGDNLSEWQGRVMRKNPWVRHP